MKTTGSDSNDNHSSDISNCSMENNNNNSGKDDNNNTNNTDNNDDHDNQNNDDQENTIINPPTPPSLPPSPTSKITLLPTPKISSLEDKLKPPSHILSDGTFIYLPCKNRFEKAMLFRSKVLKFGLLQENQEQDSVVQKEEDDITKNNNDDSEEKKEDDNDGISQKGIKKPNFTTTTVTPQVHPLAKASARLNTGPLQELTRAINLSTLLESEEYLTTAVLNRGGSSTTVDNVGVASSSTKQGTSSTTNNMNGNAANDGEKGNGSTTTTTTNTTTNPESNASSTTEQSSTNNNNSTSIKNNNNMDNDDDNDTHNTITNDSILRASYTLKHHVSSLKSASLSLKRYYRRTSIGVAACRATDQRLHELRGRWNLSAPNHGTVKGRTLNSNEIVAVDVEIYDRKTNVVGGGNSGSGENSNNGMAEKVPRYATIELSNDYIVRKDLEDLRRVSKNENGNTTNDNGHTNNDNDSNAEQKQQQPQPYPTKAVPFMMNDSFINKNNNNTYGDNDHVPSLTLVMRIERIFDGLSTDAYASTAWDDDNDRDNNNNSNNTNDDINDGNEGPDENVLRALQHSLLCAGLLDSIRAEVIDTNDDGNNNNNKKRNNNNNSETATTNASSWQKGKKKRRIGSNMIASGGGSGGGIAAGSSGESMVAWIAGGGTEETFLPPPSLMGGDLGVAHCHEGEVRIRLDPRHDLSVRLVEVGTETTNNGIKASEDNNNDNSGKEDKNAGDNDNGDINNDDKDCIDRQRLRSICRLLLLNAQLLHHDRQLQHASSTVINPPNGSSTRGRNNSTVVDYNGVGLGGGETRHESLNIPNNNLSTVTARRSGILRSCVGLGAKLLLEREIRQNLMDLSRWLQREHPSLGRLDVEWLPLSLLDTRSRFALAISDIVCIDVGIDGDVDGGSITVTGFKENDNGDNDDDEMEYRTASFGSVTEFGLHLRLMIGQKS